MSLRHPDLCSPVGWASSPEVKDTGSIPCQDTWLGCGPGPWLGLVREATVSVSLPLFLPPFSLKINKSFLKTLKTEEAAVLSLSLSQEGMPA